MNKTVFFRSILAILITGSLVSPMVHCASIHPFGGGVGANKNFTSITDSPTETDAIAFFDPGLALEDGFFQLINYTDSNYDLSIINIRTGTPADGPKNLKISKPLKLPVPTAGADLIVYYLKDKKKSHNVFAFTFCPNDMDLGTFFLSLTPLTGLSNLLHDTAGFTGCDEINDTTIMYYYLRKNHGEHSMTRVAILPHPSRNIISLEKIANLIYVRDSETRVVRPLSFIPQENECPRCFPGGCCCGCCIVS